MLTSAFAQTPGGAPGGSDLFIQLVPIGLVLVIMYFLVLRPQQTRARQHQQLIKNVRRGDTVVTTGGLIGRVTKATEDAEIELEIAQGVKVRLLRQMISDVRSKGEPVKE
ncbi:MAG: preprotein translocase subunit YajC [Methylobacteriaceae bacterium]|nr:preprotein translocase subunit YajC [Methylobacteriaceae bacterium]